MRDEGLRGGRVFMFERDDGGKMQLGRGQEMK